ncbi:alpha-ribazole phosphatase family protein [Marinimicrobium agarilyticum]|uniref:alpha-ribazole phosphatase family protein n=1 Tax=Marinimicrobium agarilyticum TaxID=306546 RepID=UPI0003F61FDC|nr:alpha-ribazole phosphatase family protein [Marinimicrobium agarilyticum]
MPETRLDLLRHGQCEGGEIFRGSHDVALTQEGWATMQARVDIPTPWDAVVTSPLQRCRAFAEAAAERLALPLIIESDLREMHFGEWEGRPYQEIWDNDPILALWGEDPEEHTPPDGEPLADFARRVNAALDRLAKSQSGRRLLVVTHGGVIRLLLTRAKGLPRNTLRDQPVPYAHFVPLNWCDGQLREVPGEAG